MSDAELLRRHGLFVAEGRLVVERVLQSGRYEVVSALMNDASLAALGPQFESTAPDVPLYRIHTREFEQVTGFNMHRGCLALVRRPAPLEWRAAVGDSRLIVVLEGVTNADNVGGVFRNAAAFGAGAILLSPTCCDPLYRKAIRTSMGSALTVPFATIDRWPDAVVDLRDMGFCVVALTPSRPSCTLAQLVRNPPSRVALVIGSEGSGLSAGALATSSLTVGIPMAPGVDSVNLVVASGIALARVNEGQPRSFEADP
jgi:tRNA G18 (ribose-2'-O)-methylase SpoU